MRPSGVFNSLRHIAPSRKIGITTSSASLAVYRPKIQLPQAVRAIYTRPVYNDGTAHDRRKNGRPHYSIIRENCALDILILNRERRVKKWGWIIYRCTYEDDRAWDRFMQAFHDMAKKELEKANAHGLLKDMELTVRNDRALFDGASKDFVRNHFNAWVQSEDAFAEQPDVVKVQRWPDVERRTLAGITTRYTFPLHVDAESLKSVLDYCDAGEFDDRYLTRPGGPYVSLIDSDWVLPDKNNYNREDYGIEPDDNEFDPANEYEEEFEGCKMHNVGWMRVYFPFLVPRHYFDFAESRNYDDLYARPPGMWKQIFDDDEYEWIEKDGHIEFVHPANKFW